MNNFEKLEENSLIIFKQNQFFSDETTHLLHQQFLALYPPLNEKEFNQIIQNVVDCLSSLILIFKNIPLTIKQIGVESIVKGKRETFHFSLIKIENRLISDTNREKKYEVEFDLEKCFMLS